jgi:adenylosuccinate synthase
MTRRIVVLSGRVASGKSALASGISNMFKATIVSTSDLLRQRARSLGVDLGADRRAFQEFGTKSDQSTNGGWLVDEIRPMLEGLPLDGVVVVDSVRLAEQLAALRVAFGRTVFHVHLTATDRDLRKRFSNRNRRMDSTTSYDTVSVDLTERQVESLAPIADLQVNTSVTDIRDVIVLCAARIGLLPPLDSRLVDVIVGGGYGSEGKGNLAYYLAPEYDVLVRVGGPNAGHQVPTQPTVTHRSLPSGSIANSNAKLFIGAGAVISAEVLRDEIVASGIDPQRLRIDPQAMVISRADVRSERRLRESIGSTGQGVGAASARRVTGRTSGKVKLAKDDRYLRQFVSDPVVDLLEQAFSYEQRVFLEGTQGAGLSLFHGHYPYVTSRDTSASACLSEAGIGSSRVRKIVMVVRSYPIRVKGTSGPMGHEITWDDIAMRSGIPVEELKSGEMSSVQHKLRRVAEFDWNLLRSDAQVNTPTDIALTFADYLSVDNRDAFRFEQLKPDTRAFVDDIEAVAAAPVSLISSRFTDRSIIDRRRWRGRVAIEIGKPSRAGQ